VVPLARVGMPLKAQLDGRELIAPFLGEAEWAAVAAAVRDGAALTLPCCGAAGGIRRSRLGRRFFYHRTTRQVPRCAWAGETAAHLVAKATIALACRRAGYRVTTEARGPGGHWVADVLATPPGGGRPLAFEVQWSEQGLDATLSRQAAYAADGVRGCWFFRRPPAQEAPDRALPIFGLALDAEDRPFVSCPFVLAPGHGDPAASFAWPLDDFVAALLARRIRFREHVTASARPAGRIVFFSRPCPGCGREALLWYVEGWTVRARSGCGVSLVRRPPRRRTVAAELAEALAPATRAVVAAFVAGRGCGLPVANVLAGRGVGRRAARGFACPRCGTPVTAGELQRDDTFRRARRRYGRRGATGIPADTPPATCPLPSEPVFTLREARPHWCYPAGDAWCEDDATAEDNVGAADAGASRP
jgi:hypothetical protein